MPVLLFMFAGLPSNVWLNVTVAVFIGIVALAISIFIKGKPFFSELIRDIGVAFVVAGVVSAVYEYSTRSIAEHETLLNTINRSMSAVVPDPVWKEVIDQVLHRNAIRRNVKIELRLSRDVVLGNGTKIRLPPNRAVLWMSLGYDLFSMASTGSRVNVEHELDYHMWDDELKLPRFDSVSVVGTGAVRADLSREQPESRRCR